MSYTCWVCHWYRHDNIDNFDPAGHCLGTAGRRGAALEALLTLLKVKAPSLQTIGMSATLSNMDELATFLNAEVYRGTFRPVQLQEYVVAGKLSFNAALITPKLRHVAGTDVYGLSEFLGNQAEGDEREPPAPLRKLKLLPSASKRTLSGVQSRDCFVADVVSYCSWLPLT